jgi:hypothetical protein
VCFSSVEELGHVCFRQWLEEEIDNHWRFWRGLRQHQLFGMVNIKDCVSTFNPLELIIT